MSEINLSFVLVAVALGASYWRWLYLIDQFWKRFEKVDRFCYERRGSPQPDGIHPGRPALKILFSDRIRKVGNPEFTAFCNRVRWFFFFHVVFTLFCVFFLLFVGLRAR